MNELVGILEVIGMTECERFGSQDGCKIDCPVLMRGDCELQETDNKELYEESQKGGFYVRE